MLVIHWRVDRRHDKLNVKYRHCWSKHVNGRTAYPEKWIEVDGYNIRYIDAGEGPVIIFLHGLGGNIEGNEECYPLLEKNFRIVAMDCPGSGWSEAPEREYCIDYLVDFTFRFADALGLDKFYVAGGSQGGLQTLLCCLKSPERVIASAVYSPSGVWKARPLAAVVVRLLPPEAVLPLMRVTSLFWNSPTHPDYMKNRKAALEHIESRDMPGFGMHVLGCLASVLEKDFRDDFAKIATPTLIMWGSHDFGMRPSMGKELHDLIDGSELEIVQGAGHNLPCEMPQLFSDRVTAFFRAHAQD